MYKNKRQLITDYNHWPKSRHHYDLKDKIQSLGNLNVIPYRKNKNTSKCFGKVLLVHSHFSPVSHFYTP